MRKQCVPGASLFFVRAGDEAKLLLIASEASEAIWLHATILTQAASLLVSCPDPIPESRLRQIVLLVFTFVLCFNAYEIV